jgi:hypothetical protein
VQDAGAGADGAIVTAVRRDSATLAWKLLLHLAVPPYAPCSAPPSGVTESTMPRKKKPAPTKPAPPKPAAPARSKTTSAVPQSKAGFVRAQSANLTAREVVDKAKAGGITLTTTYVYNVRGKSKKRRAKARPASRTSNKPRATNGARAGGAEDVLRAVAAEIGLARAIALLEDERRSVRRLIAG